MDKQQYNEYVKQITPVNNIFIDVVKAFFGGGAICLLGEIIHQFLLNNMGFEKDVAGSYTSIILVFLAILLTGFGWFAPIVKHIGAGALVPITGFANSVAAAAIEYKKEGQVFGTGCKIFIIAGPVILFGVFTSWVLGFVYWVGIVWGIIK
jgi:stage V sporulation protein AC